MPAVPRNLETPKPPRAVHDIVFDKINERRGRLLDALAYSFFCGESRFPGQRSAEDAVERFLQARQRAAHRRGPPEGG